jgi:hypothetical protein
MFELRYSMVYCALEEETTSQFVRSEAGNRYADGPLRLEVANIGMKSADGRAGNAGISQLKPILDSFNMRITSRGAGRIYDCLVCQISSLPPDFRALRLLG